jgi:hypothetical protein
MIKGNIKNIGDRECIRNESLKTRLLKHRCTCVDNIKMDLVTNVRACTEYTWLRIGGGLMMRDFL